MVLQIRGVLEPLASERVHSENLKSKRTGFARTEKERQRKYTLTNRDRGTERQKGRETERQRDRERYYVDKLRHEGYYTGWTAVVM